VHFATDIDEAASLSTYYIENIKAERAGGQEKAPIIVDLENAINAEMASRGYLEVHRNSDLKLRYEVVANQTNNYNSINQSPYYRQTVYNQSYFLNSPFNYRQFTESILLIEVKNEKTEKILWQGSLDLRFSQRAKDTNEIVVSAVKLIFDTYPFTAN
jgi:hypothetical protein